MLQACSRRASHTVLGSISPLLTHALEASTSSSLWSTQLQADHDSRPLPSAAAHSTPCLRYSILTRGFASAAEDDGLAKVQKEVDAINELFTIARDEIEYAQEESETVYFDDAVKEATAAVEACLGKWAAVLESLSEEERARLQRSMGLKMEQLKAEFEQVKNLHLEDH